MKSKIKYSDVENLAALYVKQAWLCSGPYKKRVIL